MTGYRTTIHWRAHGPDTWERERGRPGYQPEPTVHLHDTLDDAERDGAQFGCLAGTVRIEVHGPHGTLQALWDKTSTVIQKHRLWLDPRGRMIYDVSHIGSRWQTLGAESKALHRRKTAEINDLMHQEMAANRSATPARIAALLNERRQATEASASRERRAP